MLSNGPCIHWTTQTILNDAFFRPLVQIVYKWWRSFFDVGNPDLLYAAPGAKWEGRTSRWDLATNFCHGCNGVDWSGTEGCDCSADSNQVQIQFQSHRFKIPVWRAGHRWRWGQRTAGMKCRKHNSYAITTTSDFTVLRQCASYFCKSDQDCPNHFNIPFEKSDLDLALVLSMYLNALQDQVTPQVFNFKLNELKHDCRTAFIS